MINMLVPTDFTTQSVQTAERCFEALGKPCNIFLFHVFELPFYYQDLVRVPPPYSGLVTEELRQACQQLKETYSKNVMSIAFRFLQGDTHGLFRNFIQANDIHVIGCPENYFFKKVHKDSADPLPLFKKSKLPIIRPYNAFDVEILTGKRPIVKSLSLKTAS